MCREPDGDHPLGCYCPKQLPYRTPTLDNLTLTWDYEKDRFTVHAPFPIKVITRSTNDMSDGVTVIFEKRRPGEL
ncbi:hypothetical protein PBI_VANISOA_61 [Mycobacterium phage Vanisoa]|nr:hypothetical protein PBI_VANISOA_61 [Mycobacterium phage Vanisoa]